MTALRHVPLLTCVHADKDQLKKIKLTVNSCFISPLSGLIHEISKALGRGFCVGEKKAVRCWDCFIARGLKAGQLWSYIWRMRFLARCPFPLKNRPFVWLQRTLKDNQHVSGELSLSCSLLSEKKKIPTNKKKKCLQWHIHWRSAGIGAFMKGDVNGMNQGSGIHHTHIYSTNTYTLTVTGHFMKNKPLLDTLSLCCRPDFFFFRKTLSKHYPSIFHEAMA